jgi:hypothetical protein
MSAPWQRRIAPSGPYRTVIMGRHPKTFTTGDRKMLYWNANSRLAGGMHDLALFSA